MGVADLRDAFNSVSQPWAQTRQLRSPVVQAEPPMMDKIDAAFQVRGKPVIFSWGATARNYKNAAGELCCGERDCFELTDADVKITSADYYIVSIKETVPFSEAAPSPDGRYWRCQWGGSRKCFFAPPGQT